VNESEAIKNFIYHDDILSEMIEKGLKRKKIRNPIFAEETPREDVEEEKKNPPSTSRSIKQPSSRSERIMTNRSQIPTPGSGRMKEEMGEELERPVTNHHPRSRGKKWEEMEVSKMRNLQKEHPEIMDRLRQSRAAQFKEDSLLRRNAHLENLSNQTTDKQQRRRSRRPTTVGGMNVVEGGEGGSIRRRRRRNRSMNLPDDPNKKLSVHERVRNRRHRDLTLSLKIQKEFDPVTINMQRKVAARKVLVDFELVDLGVFGCVGGQDDQTSEQSQIRGFDMIKQKAKRNDQMMIEFFIYFTILLLQMKPTLLPKETLCQKIDILV